MWVFVRFRCSWGKLVRWFAIGPRASLFGRYGVCAHGTGTMRRDVQYSSTVPLDGRLRCFFPSSSSLASHELEFSHNSLTFVKTTESTYTTIETLLGPGKHEIQVSFCERKKDSRMFSRAPTGLVGSRLRS